MKTRSQLLFLSITLAISLAACAASALPPTPTAPPTEIPPTASATPSPVPPTTTPTVIPTQTAIPLTPTVEGWHKPSEEMGLTEGGEWFVFSDRNTGQIGGFNRDGTGMTWFDLPPMMHTDEWRYRKAVSHNNLAYLSANENTNMVDLIVARFPSGEIVSRIPVASSKDGWQEFMYSLGIMAWSPDGSMLAVSTGPDQTNTDIYLYRLGADDVEQLSSEEGLIDKISWSDDGTILSYTSEIESETSETGIAFIAWALDIKSGVITNVETADEEYVHHSPIYGVYDETYYSSADVTIILNLGGTSEMVDGFFIRTSEDEPPRLVFSLGYIGFIRWVEAAQRFILETEEDIIVFDKEGNIEFQSPFGDYRWYSDNFLLSPDETMASIIDSSGVLTIYQLDDGLHELWTFTNSSSIHSVYWYEDGTALIVESALHVFYVDLETQEVNLIIYEGADGFSMRQGDWMSQQE